MLVKELRSKLHAKKARWDLPAHLDDDQDLKALRAPHPLGALAPKAGALTARRPRIRPPLESPIVQWTPDISRELLRRAGRLKAALLPKSWDWRDVGNKNYVTAATNQGGCGSCVAFAATAAVESHRRILTNRPDLAIDLSEASLFFVHERQCDVGDPRYGWSVTGAMDALVDEGIAFEEHYPYRAVNQNAELVDGGAQTFKISGYDSTTTRAQMKRWLVEEGPLVTTFTVFEDFDVFWNAGASGVYSHVTGARRGGHAVAVVGYDDDQEAWICKNSWGTPGANTDGCFLIAYGDCGIDARMFLLQGLHSVVTRDELPYDPTKLHIVDEGASGWLLTDGKSRMKMFDNKEDARNGLRVARRHTRHGFVGRDNNRPDRAQYVNEYWTGNSGLPWEPLTRTDAIPYNPANVVAEDREAAGWTLTEGNMWMVTAHDMNDALAILDVVERHTRQCFIGRGNTRPNRSRYIMSYWE